MRTITEDELTLSQRSEMYTRAMHHFVGEKHAAGNVSILMWLTADEAELQAQSGGEVYRVVKSEPEPVQRDRSPSCPLCGGAIEGLKRVVHVYRLTGMDQGADPADAEWEIMDDEGDIDSVEYRCVEGHDIDDGLRKRLGIPELD